MCGHLGNPKYDGFCTHCFPQVHPEDPRVRQIRTKSKELQWVNAILECADLELPDGCEWVHDKPFYVDFLGECCPAKRRIDLHVIIGNTIVAIEIDENQHKAYAASYEDDRYNDLFVTFSGRYVFLRINPDAFKNASGERVDPPFDERFPAVVQQLQRIIWAAANDSDFDEHAPLVSVQHVFYDE